MLKTDPNSIFGQSVKESRFGNIIKPKHVVSPPSYGLCDDLCYSYNKGTLFVVFRNGEKISIKMNIDTKIIPFNENSICFISDRIAVNIMRFERGEMQSESILLPFPITSDPVPFKANSFLVRDKESKRLFCFTRAGNIFKFDCFGINVDYFNVDGDSIFLKSNNKFVVYPPNDQRMSRIKFNEEHKYYRYNQELYSAHIEGTSLSITNNDLTIQKVSEIWCEQGLFFVNNRAVYAEQVPIFDYSTKNKQINYVAMNKVTVAYWNESSPFGTMIDLVAILKEMFLLVAQFFQQPEAKAQGKILFQFIDKHNWREYFREETEYFSKKNWN